MIASEGILTCRGGVFQPCGIGREADGQKCAWLVQAIFTSTITTARLLATAFTLR